MLTIQYIDTSEQESEDQPQTGIEVEVSELQWDTSRALSHYPNAIVGTARCFVRAPGNINEKRRSIVSQAVEDALVDHRLLSHDRTKWGYIIHTGNGNWMAIPYSEEGNARPGYLTQGRTLADVATYCQKQWDSIAAAIKYTCHKAASDALAYSEADRCHKLEIDNLLEEQRIRNSSQG